MRRRLLSPSPPAPCVTDRSIRMAPLTAFDRISADSFIPIVLAWNAPTPDNDSLINGLLATVARYPHLVGRMGADKRGRRCFLLNNAGMLVIEATAYVDLADALAAQGMSSHVYELYPKADKGLEHVKARLVFQSKLEATEAFGELHGRNIYDGCYHLDIKWGLLEEKRHPKTRASSSSNLFQASVRSSGAKEHAPVTGLSVVVATTTDIVTGVIKLELPTSCTMLGSDVDFSGKYIAAISQPMKVVCEGVPAPEGSTQTSSPMPTLASTCSMEYPCYHIEALASADISNAATTVFSSSLQTGVPFPSSALEMLVKPSCKDLLYGCNINNYELLGDSVPLDMRGKSTLVLWPMLMKWLEQQPWPPPAGLEPTSGDAYPRPLQWPFFHLAEGFNIEWSCFPWKPPWPPPAYIDFNFLPATKMVEGTSMSFFFTAWDAAVCTGGTAVLPSPFTERAAVAIPLSPPAPASNHCMFWGEDGDDRSTRRYDVIPTGRIESFTVHFPEDLITGLKARVGAPCSTFQCLLAHAWNKVIPVRSVPPGKLTQVRVTVNCRSRASPPAPANFFGNMVLWAFPRMHASDLLFSSYATVVGAIREAVAFIDAEYIQSFVDFAETTERGGEKLPSMGLMMGTVLCPDLEVDSWLGFRFHDLDFGCGPSCAFLPPDLPIEGLMFFTPPTVPSSGINLFLVLHNEHVEAFKQICYTMDMD
ncbi:unnamed protein product [Urochloa decumbens]|uniref:Uncharacterized protein n=1 Tax=Urochloa decumbens TaxID=240449 RepID=A0ABC9HAP1_9POAL